MEVGVGVGGTEIAVGTGTAVLVGAGVGGTGIAVGAGTGDGVGAGVASNSSITADMSSKEGDPSYFVPVWLGSVERTKMVGVTETSFRRAKFMSL